MSNVSEHDREQERERYDRKQTGVDFLIRRNTIAVDDSLEAFRELVNTMERRWFLGCMQLLENWRDIGTRCFLRLRNLEIAFGLRIESRASSPLHASTPI